MANKPPPQQPIPALQPPNQHHPTIEHPRPTPPQQFPTIWVLLLPPQAEISTSPSHQQNGTSPRAISTSYRLLPTPLSHPTHRMYTADIHANGKCIRCCMFRLFCVTRPHFVPWNYVVFILKWWWLFRCTEDTTNPRNTAALHSMVRKDVWRCRVVDSSAQPTVMVASEMHKNDPTISLSEMRRTTQ